MMATVSTVAARVGESTLACWCTKVGDLLDCVIPIVLAIAAIIGMGSVAFGFVH
jgi:hypothetical protein